MLKIRDAIPSDELAWRQLWEGYLAFYETVLPETVTSATWQRALDPASSIIARLAERDGTVRGFALAVIHAHTWATTPACYLEDLFVDPDARGLGIGGALIRDLIEMSAAHGWSRLYWHTRSSNPARVLYDRFTPADDFVRYKLAPTT
jgi:GNAT superfamily N-acetyltransferase